ncbi:hypothetical protein PSYJYH_000041 [Bacillus phage PSYJ-YH]|nr:hypothetical protein PSYJYH_000041 [Bacillus phage PSYJ-YH]
MAKIVKSFELNCKENGEDVIKVNIYDDGEAYILCEDELYGESVGAVINIKEFINLLGGNQ